MGLSVRLIGGMEFKYCHCCESSSWVESEVYDANITHNLNTMAKEAGIYEALWNPIENEWFIADDIIDILQNGLAILKAKPDYYKSFNSPNGWGTYKYFVPFVEKYLNACIKYPDAKISIDK